MLHTVRNLLATALVLGVIDAPAAARPEAPPSLDALAGEYGSLCQRRESLRKTLALAPANLSPARDERVREEERVAAQVEGLRARLATVLVEGAGEGRHAEAAAAVQSLDPSLDVESIRELRRMLRDRLAKEVAAPGVTAARQAGLLALERALAEGPAAPASPAAKAPPGAAPVYIAFHWHMHQPIYWPGEDVLTTHQRGVYSYDLLDLFRARHGPYTSWPRNAIAAGKAAGLGSLGAQVSFSGSLIENLDHLARVEPSFRDWAAPYREARGWKTAAGNPRLDLVAFGFHHPLMALVDYPDIRRQIRMHRDAVQKAFGAQVPPSRGIFPPENAFAEWMVPALVDEGLAWVMVDNIHFSRACRGYPWVAGENLPPPNPADQTNPDPGGWIQLQGLWAPSRESAWASRPHYVSLKDPDTGQIMRTPEGREAKMIAVPASRYLGNEDGRGGFGALDYERVMSQFLPHNTDPRHPVLLVLHHDGDNYGGGTESYYHGNFQRFVEWVKANPERFVPTTVEDYLARFPPDPEDVIHVEPGSWSGADNGDPEFHKWNGDPDQGTGYSPDRNSWGVLTAARNIVQTAAAAAPDDPRVGTAWNWLLVSETSCYEYWDGTEMWDSHPTRGANQAVAVASAVLGAGKPPDRTPPTIYAPQREPYNPGGIEWGQQPMPRELSVWTYVHDASGLASVALEHRIEGTAPKWVATPMTGRAIPSQTVPKPTWKAEEYTARLALPAGTLCTYRVAATDRAGNTARSFAQRVHIGDGAGPAPGPVPWKPREPAASDRVTIVSDRPGKLHWAVDGWIVPPKRWWPAGTTAWTDGKAVETPLAEADGGGYAVTLGPFEGEPAPPVSVEFVFHHADGSWGRDWKIPIAARR